MVRIVSPDAGTTVFTRDAAGRQATATRADGSVVSYTYDLLDRVTSESATWPTGSGMTGAVTQSYGYDTCAQGKGRLCSMTDASGSTTYAYLDTGELASQTSTINGVSL